MPGAKVDSSPDLLRVKTGTAARTAEWDLSGADPGGKSAGRHRRRALRFSFGTHTDDVVGRPFDGRANLGKYLEDSGLDHAGELSAWRSTWMPSSLICRRLRKLSIDPVRDEETLKVWLTALATGYDWPMRQSADCSTTFGAADLDRRPVRNYLGRWKGEPVASSSLFFVARVGGCLRTVVRNSGSRDRRRDDARPLASGPGGRISSGDHSCSDYRLGFHRKLGFKPTASFSTYVLRSPATPREIGRWN